MLSFLPVSGESIDLATTPITSLEGGQQVVDLANDVYSRFPSAITGSGHYSDQSTQQLGYTVIGKQSSGVDMGLPEPESGVLHSIYAGENGDWTQVFYGMQLGTIWMRKHTASTWLPWGKVYPRKPAKVKVTKQIYSGVITFPSANQLPAITNQQTELIEEIIPVFANSTSVYSYTLMFKFRYIHTLPELVSGASVYPFLLKFSGFNQDSEGFTFNSAELNAYNASDTNGAICCYNPLSTVGNFMFTMKCDDGTGVIAPKAEGQITGRLNIISSTKLV